MLVSALSLAAALCLAQPGIGADVASHAHASKFRQIFGAGQFDAHFSSPAAFTASLQGKQQMLKQQQLRMSKMKNMDPQSAAMIDSDLSNYILCTTHVGGEAMRQSLNSHFGEENVQPLYQSASDNSFCFLVAVPFSEQGVDQSVVMSLATMSGTSIEFVLPQPDVMKIHHSVLDHLLLAGHKKSDQNDVISSSKLSVSLGLGNGQRKSARSRSTSMTNTKTSGGVAEDSLKRDLLAKHPHEHVQRLMQSSLEVDAAVTVAHPSGKNVEGGIQADSTSAASDKGLWHAAYEELSASTRSRKVFGSSSSSGSVSARDADTCLFSKLIFSHGHDQAGDFAEGKEALSFTSGSSFSIAGLGHITAEAATPTSCFAALLAFLATNEEHITDIRYTLPDKLLNKYGKSVVQKMTSDQGTPYTDADLTGLGQVVGVGDSGVDERSCFFANDDQSLVARSRFYAPTYDNSKRKVIQYIDYANDYDTANGHGTHVCGTVAGAYSTAADNGHAEGAKIAFFDMSIDGSSIFYPTPIDSFVFRPAFLAGAKIHSNSWGSALNLYQEQEINVDSYHLEEDQFLALFAAGNEGDAGYFSVGSPAVSKNAMAIGASRASSSSGTSFAGPMDEVAYFSSLGPTFDMRIKPDVVAPGSYVSSAAASGSVDFTCSTLTMQGTSMATPGVAGIAAQIRQYFEDDRFWAATCRSTAVYATCLTGAFAPRGATVKAVLIHSGEAMASYANGGTEPAASLGNQPDFYQGFGRVFLQNVLPFAGIETVLDLYVEEVVLLSNVKLQFEVVVTDVTRPVKITVVWMDPINTVISNKLLLHDIDVTLQLKDSSTVVYGNNNENDEINNVEQAMVATPVVGTYLATITTKTFTENMGSQKASIVITSGGSVTSRHLTSSSSASTSSCSAGEQLITMNLLDRGADGWPSGASYNIRDSSNTLVKSGELGSDASQDFNVPVNFCLPSSDVYSVSLHLPEGNDDAMDVGLEIPQCKVYLSYYQINATLDLSTDVSQCNPCGAEEMPVSLYFTDGVYLNHYGWNRGSTYVLSKVPNGNYSNVDNDEVQLEGSLLYGYVGWIEQCLSAGSYRLTFDGASSDDDDAYSGEGLYTASLVGCDKQGNNDDVGQLFDDDKFYPYPFIFEEHQMKITVASDGSCMVDISQSTDNSDPSGASPRLLSAALQTATAAAALIAAGLLML